MDTTQIVIALIGFVGAILSVWITSKTTQEKVTNEIQTQNRLQDQKIDQIVADMKNSNDEMTKKIQSCNRDLTEKMDTQNELLNLKIEHLTDTQKNMSKDIESHNNYAKMFSENVPVIKEKIEVANKRIADLEADVKHYHG